MADWVSLERLQRHKLTNPLGRRVLPATQSSLEPRSDGILELELLVALLGTELGLVLHLDVLVALGVYGLDWGCEQPGDRLVDESLELQCRVYHLPVVGGV